MSRHYGNPETYFCGHPRTPENSYLYAGRGRCLQCKRARANSYYRVKRGLWPAPCELQRVWS